MVGIWMKSQPGIFQFSNGELVVWNYHWVYLLFERKHYEKQSRCQFNVQMKDCDGFKGGNWWVYHFLIHLSIFQGTNLWKIYLPSNIIAELAAHLRSQFFDFHRISQEPPSRSVSQEKPLHWDTDAPTRAFLKWMLTDTFLNIHVTGSLI